MSTSNTVMLRVVGSPVRGEALCDGTPLPGHLLKKVSTGHVAVHATAGGFTAGVFAIEDEAQGKDITTAYTASTICQYWIPRKGDIVQARLKASENVAIGDPLESAGDGTLQKYTANTADIHTGNIVGFAEEASNVGTVARIAVSIR